MPELLKNMVRATVPRDLRNWLRSPRKSAEWLYDSMCYSFGARRPIDVLPDVRLMCHPNAYKVYRSAQLEDPEQREELLSFVSCCCVGMRLFDIGAHFGIFSIMTAKLGGTSVAVDPSPISQRMLNCQCMLNNCVDTVHILQAAANDTGGLVGMLSAGVFTPGYFKVDAGRPQRELTQTPAVTVDEMTRRFGVPTHVKIDVEGHEIAVLRGAQCTLSEFAPFRFLELHNDMIRSASGDPMTCLTQLEEHGYTLYRTSGEIADKATLSKPAIVRIVGQPRPKAPTTPC